MVLWIKVLVTVFTLAVVLISAFLFIGVKRNKSKTKALVKKLTNASSIEKLHMINFASLSELPKPIEQYFRNVLFDGQKFINSARFQQIGELKVNPKSKNWSIFKASYFVSQNPVSFIWDAKVK